MATSLFQANGNGTKGSAIWYLVALGIVGALTALIVSFALPIGPWWSWLLAIGGFVWLGVWDMKRSAVTIELLDDNGQLRLKLSGRGGSLDEPIRSAHDAWTHVVNRSVRYGGLVLSYNLTVRTVGGRRIGFKFLGGGKDRWPERRERLANGRDVYDTLGVFGLEKALAAQAAAAAPRSGAR